MVKWPQLGQGDTCHMAAPKPGFRASKSHYTTYVKNLQEKSLLRGLRLWPALAYALLKLGAGDHDPMTATLAFQPKIDPRAIDFPLV